MQHESNESQHQMHHHQQHHSIDLHQLHHQHSSTAVTVVPSNELEHSTHQRHLIISSTPVEDEGANSVIISGDPVLVGDISTLHTVSENLPPVTTQSSSLTPVELQNLQLSWPTRMWTNDLTLRLLEKIQRRKSLLFDPKLRRRSVYSEVAEEFQGESIPFTTSDIEKKYTSLLSTYRRNLERKSGSTWQYFEILEDIYSEIDLDGNKVHLPTSNINPSGSMLHPAASTIDAASSKPQVRQSKRMRSRPARLKGHVDYSSEGTTNRYDSEAIQAEAFDKVRDLVHERLDELQEQREKTIMVSNKAWNSIREEMDLMHKNIETLNTSVMMLTQTVSAVLNGLTKFKKT